MLISFLSEAKQIKQNNERLIGLTLNPEITPLLKIVILQMTPTNFGNLWAAQREVFEDEDDSKVVTDEEFERQLIAFDEADLTKKEDHFYEVIGVFRSKNGEPRFQPIETLLASNSL